MENHAGRTAQTLAEFAHRWKEAENKGEIDSVSFDAYFAYERKNYPGMALFADGPKDAWGNELKLDGDLDATTILSAGEDAQVGTEDDISFKIQENQLVASFNPYEAKPAGGGSSWTILSVVLFLLCGVAIFILKKREWLFLVV